MQFSIEHTNLTVLDIEKSLKFYSEALGLKPSRSIDAEDGSFKIVYLSDGVGKHQLELTWYAERKQPYNLGDNEIHIAFRVDNFEQALEKHKKMDCVCYQNEAMGIYFIVDPDGHWLEIMPNR